MTKVYLICGKICTGKSYYTEKLATKTGAVVLSCDELSLTLFPKGLGDAHDEVLENVKIYFKKKSLELLSAGCDVILEWGFWKREDRAKISEFYEENRVPYEWHYMEIADDIWEERIMGRNRKVEEALTRDYYVDEGLKMKCLSLFEAPDEAEKKALQMKCIR